MIVIKCNSNALRQPVHSLVFIIVILSQVIQARGGSRVFVEGGV